MDPKLHLRYATTDDVPEIVRLRAVMWTSMGLAVSEDGWRERCAEVLDGWLRNGIAGAAVAEHPEGEGLVACGVGSIDQRLPGSSNLSGRYGYIANMVTEADFRGRGLAGGILRLLLAWYEAQGVRTVDLHASAQGESIYRANGFAENAQAALRWRAG